MSMRGNPLVWAVLLHYDAAFLHEQCVMRGEPAGVIALANQVTDLAEQLVIALRGPSPATQTPPATENPQQSLSKPMANPLA